MSPTTIPTRIDTIHNRTRTDLRSNAHTSTNFLILSRSNFLAYCTADVLRFANPFDPLVWSREWEGNKRRRKIPKVHRLVASSSPVHLRPLMLLFYGIKQVRPRTLLILRLSYTSYRHPITYLTYYTNTPYISYIFSNRSPLER